jgi:cadmium resistance protein CadD (predicted permease)
VNLPANTVSTAVGVFVSTNIDDFVLLLVLVIDSRAKGLRNWQIVAGQYLGFVALILASLGSAAGLLAVPQDWVGLLGLVPLALGVHGLLRGARAYHAGADSPTVATGLLSVATLTVANGGDNVATYIVLFRVLNLSDLLVTLGAFLLLLGLWCVLAMLVCRWERVVPTLIRLGRRLVPGVFILIGIVILTSSGVVVRIAELFR